jgi:hypothetical protein
MTEPTGWLKTGNVPRSQRFRAPAVAAEFEERSAQQKGVTVEDVMNLVVGVYGATAQFGRDSEAASRLLSVVVDGFELWIEDRHRAHIALPQAGSSERFDGETQASPHSRDLWSRSQCRDRPNPR